MNVNVILATRTVRLAVEDTADSACPATQAGTDKNMDVYPSVQLGKPKDLQLKRYIEHRALLIVISLSL